MINIRIGQELKQQFSITADSLFFCPVKIYNNMLDDKSLIVSEFDKKSGIYLLHNLDTLTRMKLTKTHSKSYLCI